MASVREAGWDAFQQGNIEEAIRLLDAACREDPTDFEAHLNLGAAYGRAERHEEAISTLIAAVHLQPANAQARYDLGAAMERAGHVPEALEAFRQATQLDAGCLKAAEAIQRIEAVEAQNSEVRIQNSEAVEAIQRLEAVEAAREPETPGFSASSSPGSTALPSHGLLSDYAPSPNAPSGPTAVMAPYSPEMPPPNYDDEIDIPRAIRDFGRILVTPDKFFREQAGKNGLMSPILMVGIYLALQMLEVVIRSGAQGLYTLIWGIILSPISLAVTGMQMLVVYLISALLVHFLGWIFGNRQDYSVSVRACVYADAPRFLLTLIGSIYMAFFVMPAYMANPITPAEIEQAMGLPAGSMTGAGTTYSTPSAGKPPVVIISSPDAGDNSIKDPAASPASGSRPTGGKMRQSTAHLPSGSARPKKGSSTGHIRLTRKPQPSLTMFTGLAELVWRRFGGTIAFSLALWAIGWFWSSVLLALAIHRLQQIPAAAAAGVVVIMYSLALLLLLVIALALRGPVTSLIQLILQASGVPAGGAGH